jgi:anti-sigma B factor antagonist
LNREQPLLDVTEIRQAGRIRVRLRGELDLAGAARLSEELRRLRARGEDVLLDYDELRFIDMSGLRVVLQAAREAADDGSAFAVTRGSASVRRLLRLVPTDGRLRREDA